ncbi:MULTISPECIES: YmiA family putative membrane protein [Citrobacter]|nr:MULTISPECIES: YmiA family putative membrane protein [Citrobacter]MCT4723819.1 YmiA family putative membrane protein [Citrobacter freundii]MCT4749636.1 YmiA family putative membrane protein [Citrobacter freundii]MCX3147285.1 YmiA family putative membrane protein [Citrobacter freundii]MDD7816140.1 YmiA family putative membrane protein [Citrobacter freundii complex sp. 2022EL-00793]MDE8818928.1 YmiA family putative membrane protein [Citrobacter freundii]
MRLAMPSGNQPARRDPVMKRKAWFAVFLGSAIFWIVVALVAWNVWG